MGQGMGCMDMRPIRILHYQLVLVIFLCLVSYSNLFYEEEGRE